MMKRRAFLTSSLGMGLVGLTPTLSFAGGHGRIGTFTGNARYGIGGRAEIAGNQVILLDDFKFGSAPDPKVALGRDGYDPKTLMGLLKAKSGKQTYQVPAGIDPAQYNEVWIWCEKFNVPLGVAKIN